jgi:hypothetical protein
MTKIQPPSYRHCLVVEWLKKAQGQCPAGFREYMINRAPVVLGTAYDLEVKLLMHGLTKPADEGKQAVKQKRRL